METKTTFLSGLLALLLFSASMAGCLASPDEEEEFVSPVESPIDLAPVVSSWNHTFNYGVAVEISGTVWDEEYLTSMITLRVTSSAPQSTLVEEHAFAPTSSAWATSLSTSSPGEYMVVATAVDSAGHTSLAVLFTLVIIPPVELSPAVLIEFVQEEAGEGAGTLEGSIVHAYIETCSATFITDSGSELAGDVNPSTARYSIAIEADTERNGTLIVECGLFTTTSTSVDYLLPEPPSPEDTDGDGITDDNDECAGTPDGESVFPTGCSESQLDSDADGVSDAEDECPGHDDAVDVDGDSIPDGCDELIDSDGDGIEDSVDQCPSDVETENGYQDQDGCPDTVPNEWNPEDSWVCTDGQGPWVKDYNEDMGYTANDNGASSANGGGSGPWFQCVVSVSVQNGEMVMESNGIPNHDFLSTLGCCADEMDFTAYIPLNPVNDTSGGHTTTNCPASAGRWECAPDRGAVAIGVNGVPIYGPEEGPGGDAVALHFNYFDEDRQPIELGWCAGHSAGAGGYHYHYDANCIHWEPGMGEDMSSYDLSKIPSDQHSPIVGWAFDGYPIYGIHGYDEDGHTIRKITSSYAIERTQDGGDQGYNGIDDWNYVDGIGDLDECNGRFGPTPEYPEGIYHYVSTSLSGSPTPVIDTDGNTVGMIGFPYFLLCYYGIADLDSQDVGGGQGGGGGPPPPPPGGHGTSNAFSAESFEGVPVNGDDAQDPVHLMLLLGIFVFTVKLLSAIPARVGRDVSEHPESPLLDSLASRPESAAVIRHS